MNNETHGVTDLVQLLRRRARNHADRVSCQGIGPDGRPAERLTYSDLDRQARAVAGLLRTITSPGDRVVLLFPTGVNFVAALFGCWYAGTVAVPLPFPALGQQTDRSLAHLSQVVQEIKPTVTLTIDGVIAELARRAPSQFGIFATVDQAIASDLPWEPMLGRHDVAVLQYTSGSTAIPKGVLIGHQNYLHNLRMLTDFTQSIAPDHSDIQMVSWLPHFHDMGLALLLYTLYHGGTATLIPPLAFLHRPDLWLRTMSEVHANLTAAPNFAFDLCVRRIAPQQREGLDLSSLSIVLNAAEPVRPETLESFAEHFAPYGFAPTAFAPCFGLAEGTVFVTGLRQGGPPRVVRFHRRSLHDGIGVACHDAELSRPMVSCGKHPEGLTIRIVDPVSHTERGPGMIGEIWVHGPSVGLGYWERAAQTGATFSARLAGFDERPYLRTGDLGFQWNGELFVVGRLADLITVDGRTLHPQDLEYTVQCSDDAFAGRRCVVFAYSTDARSEGRPAVTGRSGSGSSRLAVAVEVRVDLPIEIQWRDGLHKAVRQAVAAEHDVNVTDVLLVPTGTIPVTTSGKVRRAKCRALFLSGELSTL